MAEIKIERKNRNNKNNKLVWILALFLFLVLGIFWWIGTDNEEEEAVERPTTEQPTSGTAFP